MIDWRAIVSAMNPEWKDAIKIAGGALVFGWGVALLIFVATQIAVWFGS